MSNTCFVCCEPYNRSARSKIVCNFDDCGYECCKNCIRAYLLTTRNDPHCMKCKRAYTQNFMVTYLNRSFIDNDFKKHRRQLLIDHELSRMPETMQLAENYKKIDIYQENVNACNERIQELQKQLREFHAKKLDNMRKIVLLKSGNVENGEKKKFVFPCPAQDCRGYLSTQYKCGSCNLYTCPKCHEIIGHNRDDPHTCDPNNIASAEEIKKTCKACPSCGVHIQKISGCDQMYCTECRIAFSWNTGKIDNTGNIHNPHFYQQMKNENGGQAHRNPQDILCGGLINYHQLGAIRRKIHSIKCKGKIDNIDRVKNADNILCIIHRLVNHITNHDVPRLRQRVRELEDNKILRVEYINMKRSKDDLANAVYRNDIQRKKTIDVLQINEILSVVGIENFTNIYNSKEIDIDFLKQLEKFVEDYKNLIRYTNREMKLVSVTYNHKVMIIDVNNFEWHNKKYQKSQLNDIIKSNSEK